MNTDPTETPASDTAAVVEAAFREGYRCGYSNGGSDAHPLASRALAGSVDDDWTWSDARAALAPTGKASADDLRAEKTHTDA